jgi:hypothetical protein
VDLKKWTWLALALVLFAGVTGTPAKGQTSYMGVYLDESRTTRCATGTGVYQVEVWVYAYVEGSDGIQSWGFEMNFPPNVDMLSWVANPDAIDEICQPTCPPGESGSFNKCQFGWVWIRRGTFNVTTSDPGVIEIIPHPTSGQIALTGCLGAVYYPTVVSSSYVNYDPTSPECSGPVPVAETTWGVVKTMYRDG